MKKRLHLFSALMVIALLLVACGGSSSAPAADTASKASSAPAAASSAPAEKVEPMDISVIIETFDNTFASFVMNTMKEHASENPQYKITYLDSKQDAATQIGQVESQIINGTQAIICLAVDAKQSAPIVQACKDGEVPLIAFNRPFEGADTFVGADGVVAGQLQAGYAAELLDGKGKVALINGIMGQENQFIRADAIKATFEKDYPDIEISLEGAADWKRDKALALVENWLQSGTEFSAILCLNDDMAIGAQIAVEQAGKAGEIYVLGINGDPDGMNGVKDGKLAATVFQNPAAQALIALETAAEYINGGKPEAKVLVPFELITPDNLDEYLKYI